VRTPLLKGGIALTMAVPILAALPFTANAAVPPSCGGVLQGGGDSGTLTKTITGVTTNPDGTTTVRFRYTSDRGAGSFRLRDCAFIDANSNGMFDMGEAIVGGTDQRGVPSSGTGSITVTIPDGAQLCDRLALSGTSEGVGFTDKSNIACVGSGYPTPPGY
jgi:hypothetical protein